MIILGVAIVGAAFAFNEYRGALSTAPVSYSTPSISAPINTTTSTADSDWQKVLVGTGVAGSAQKNSLSAGAVSAHSQSLTATDKLGEALFSQYTQLESSGLATDPTSIDNAVSNTLANQTIFTKPKTYTAADISITAANTPDALRIYANDVATVLQSHDSNEGSEVQLAQEAIQQSDPSILAQIDPVISNYQAIIQALLGISVPPTMIKEHIDLLNSVSMMLSSAQLLRHSDADAVGGIQAIVQDKASLQGLVVSIDEIGNVLKSSHVQFTSVDVGRILENYIDPTTIGGSSDVSTQNQ